MRIKWNWGTAIFLAIVLFMAFIFVLVYQTTTHSVDLVEKDYYPKGLKFQDRIDETNNARQYTDQFVISQSDDQLILSFPDISPDSGTITFFRPSDTKFDRVFQIDPGNNQAMQFQSSEFKRGKYLLKIQWVESEKSYYLEKPFFFN